MFCSDKPFPSICHRQLRSPVPLRPPKYVFQHAHPSAHARRRGSLARTGCTCTTARHLSFTTLSSKLFASASANKIFACSARHDTCTKPAVPRQHAPAHEALLRFPMERLRADVARLAPRVLRARLRCDSDGLRVFRIGIDTARRRLLSLSSCRACHGRPPPSVFSGTRAAVARFAAAALFGGQIRQRGSADRALREDHRGFCRVRIASFAIEPCRLGAAMPSTR